MNERKNERMKVLMNERISEWKRNEWINENECVDGKLMNGMMDG